MAGVFRRLGDMETQTLVFQILERFLDAFRASHNHDWTAFSITVFLQQVVAHRRAGDVAVLRAGSQFEAKRFVQDCDGIVSRPVRSRGPFRF